jgi:hypothetical protein
MFIRIFPPIRCYMLITHPQYLLSRSLHPMTDLQIGLAAAELYEHNRSGIT